MHASNTVGFADPRGIEHDLVGGKGANLGRLTQAGFQVPPGFTITVNAYEGFMAQNDFGKGLSDRIAAFATDDPVELERLTAALRHDILAMAIPATVVDDIAAAYAEMGEDPFVAVRSSGTAEDLAGASFAGLHDTILGMRGIGAVLEAVKICWASMWSARAVSYRNTMGFPHHEASIAVVIQRLIDSETAGVLFTGNPINASTEEYVINASWGLGEAVVSGIVSPDQIIIRARDFVAREKLAGDKALRIRRDPASGQGTLEEHLTGKERTDLCLTDDQIRQLGELGRAVTDYYDHLPQDLEWAFQDGQLYLLQSRPITGVDFSWDELCDDFQAEAGDDDDIVYNRTWADELWNNAITPMMYSMRGHILTELHRNTWTVCGRSDVAKKRYIRFHRSTAYESAEVERDYVHFNPPFNRQGFSVYIPPSWREDALKQRFSWLDYLRAHATIYAVNPDAGLHRWMDLQYRDYVHNKEFIERARGLGIDELAKMSDSAIKHYIDGILASELKFYLDLWTGFFVHATAAMSLLQLMLAHWYDGDNEMVFVDLITGVPRPTYSMHENWALWDVAQELKKVPDLLGQLDVLEGDAFFDAARKSDAAAGFVAAYDRFMSDWGHRGREDRDFYYPSRFEDSRLVQNSLKSLVSSTGTEDPRHAEEKVSKQRNKVLQEVCANIMAKPLGLLKAEALKVVHDYALKFLMLRDDERNVVDMLTWGGKKGFLELNRRLVERGVLAGPEDFYFLTTKEFYEVIDGAANMVWTKAKIAGRRANFERFRRKEADLPVYMKAGRGLPELENTELVNAGGGMRGVPTSRGKITGMARVVRHLSEIGTIRQGDIMITNATDPGWTPVFLVIKGLVLETGGALAHGSCMAREYGLPSVQLTNAMKLIPDGATITVDGTTGLVEIVDDFAAAAE